MSEAAHTGYRMTVEAFTAFTAERPDWQKWELIDGEAIVQATPAKRHQVIVTNLLYELEGARRKLGASWHAFAGIGARLPRDKYNEIIPDVMVMPPGDDLANWTYDVLGAFEVLSPGSVRRDMVRKRQLYTRMERLTHYVVLAQNRCEATVFARSQGFSPVVLTGSDDRIEIDALGVSIRLADAYRDVQLDP